MNETLNSTNGALVDPWLIGLLSGVVSSVIASIFIWVCFILWEKAIIPKIEEFSYKGTNLSSTWKNTLQTEENRFADGTMVIEQKGHRIKGELTVTSKKDSEQHTVIYKIEGHVRDNYVEIHATAADRKYLSMSSGIFLIKNVGKVLHGAAVVTDNFSAEILAQKDIIWYRVP